MTYKTTNGDCFKFRHQSLGENILNHCWPHRDALACCDEGRSSELSRQLTFLVLFTREGRPGLWLMLVGALWGLVAASTLGALG